MIGKLGTRLGKSGKRWLLSTLTLAIMGLTWCQASHGAIITQVTSAGSLAADDFINWGQLGSGPDTTVVPLPTSVVSDLGKSATISDVPVCWAVEQGSSWAGNFTPGERLFYQPFAGSYTISFATPVQGAGFNIQAGYYGVFTATLSAYGSGNVLFDTVQVTGNSTGDADGSAVFLGLTSDLADITAITINAQQIVNPLEGIIDTSFAINQLQIVSNVAPVPEPASASILVLGGATMLLLGRRRR